MYIYTLYFIKMGYPYYIYIHFILLKWDIHAYIYRCIYIYMERGIENNKYE